ncbi:hypothetical protein PG985_003473 [Apiospora marii]|uniref:uncharacterized protein n=1 Tax=Apiospora marii TaxID=335849 RepID=UPI00312D014B
MPVIVGLVRGNFFDVELDDVQSPGRMRFDFAQQGGNASPKIWARISGGRFGNLWNGIFGNPTGNLLNHEQRKL